MQNESRSGVEKVGLDTSRSFFQMRCFVTSIIERPRHFYAFNTPETTTSSTPKITKSPLTASLLLDGASSRVQRHHREARWNSRSEEHTSELQSRGHLVCRLLL